MTTNTKTIANQVIKRQTQHSRNATLDAISSRLKAASALKRVQKFSEGKPTAQNMFHCQSAASGAAQEASLASNSLRASVEAYMVIKREAERLLAQSPAALKSEVEEAVVAAGEALLRINETLNNYQSAAQCAKQAMDISFEFSRQNLESSINGHS